jgi:hypothetical protein
MRGAISDGRPDPDKVSGENGRSRLGQSEISRDDVLSFYAYGARLLLFACS